VVFFSGIFFLVITLLGIREKIINAIPVSLRLSVAAGIGLFITFIGLTKMGVVANSEATLVHLGQFSIPLLLSLIGLITIAALEVRKVKGSILIGILLVTILAIVTGQQEFPELSTLVSTPPSIEPIFWKINFGQAFSFGLMSAAFSFMFVDLFDSIGTIMACAHNAGMVDEEGNIQKVDKILEADAIATVVGACMGTSTTTTYIESGSGIAAGGRTGLTSITVAVLFLLCLFFTGVIGIVPAYATAPALVMVGIHMFRNVKEIDFKDIEVAIPSFLTIIIMPLTYNISLGIAFGFISYIIISVASGDRKKICPTMWVIGLLSLIQLSIEWKVVDFVSNLFKN
jgi:AGZA family xanthine/uracil permease-like MFS transporter